MWSMYLAGANWGHNVTKYKSSATTVIVQGLLYSKNDDIGCS